MTYLAALRRVAALVAREASEQQVFEGIAGETRRLVGADHVRIWRFEGDTVMPVASAGAFKDVMPVGLREPLRESGLAGRVHRTGRSERIDDYGATEGPSAERALALGVGSAAAIPIIVEGRRWGAVVAATRRSRGLPADAEARMRAFTELTAPAIANTESQARADRLAGEQAALRRVALLVAQGASADAVFDAAAAEIAEVLGADRVVLARNGPGDELTVVAHRGADIAKFPPGTQFRPAPDGIVATVRRTGRPARLDSYARGARIYGERVVVGAPITIDGQVWGVSVATWAREDPPAGTEQRMQGLAQLLDTAIANVDTRDQLNASRERLLTEADEARRRVVRDLHDGAQQRLVHAIITLKLARRALERDDGNAARLIDEALEQARLGNAELRELAHGMHPSVLARGGLRAGVGAVVQRLELPVHIDVLADRLRGDIEASAYFIVAEALVNVLKHAHATRAQVTASIEGANLIVEVRDDGIGGADPRGHGLVGMDDRVATLGGRLRIESPAGGGTLVSATLPLGERDPPAASQATCSAPPLSSSALSS
jgi:signal transduction histidine kinase